MSELSPEAIRERFGLEPMPLEGGWFRQTWRGPESDGRPAGTAILVLLTVADGEFSAMHRLPIDENWFFHAGDPVRLLLLDPPSGGGTTVWLGPAFDRGHVPQLTVPAGTWMGGAPDGPLGWSLFGCTMTPGFISADYLGADPEQLGDDFPDFAVPIRRLCRPGAALRHPGADDAGPTAEGSKGG